MIYKCKLYIILIVFCFLLGNANIHRITSQGYYDLNIDLEDLEGNTRYALYKNFSVSSEDDFFRLSVGAYSGDAGNVFAIYIYIPKVETCPPFGMEELQDALCTAHDTLIGPGEIHIYPYSHYYYF